jgi:hypothetical protein
VQAQPTVNVINHHPSALVVGDKSLSKTVAERAKERRLRAFEVISHPKDQSQNFFCAKRQNRVKKFPPSTDPWEK